MKKTRIKIPPKTKAELQREINSECPFCQNVDVGCFETHHIDGNRANNAFMNLLMLCPNCHTKIEKGDTSKSEVVKRKNDLQLSIGKIEFVSIVIDSSICNWVVSPENEFAFFDNGGNKSEHPILNFTFINHSSKTVILKTIDIKVEDLPSGLSGLGPEPSILKPLVKYYFQLKFGKELNTYHLPNPISVPSNQSFLFQVELSMVENSNETYPIDGRKALNFTFQFSDGVKAKSPTTYFNCNGENDTVQISILS